MTARIDCGKETQREPSKQEKPMNADAAQNRGTYPFAAEPDLATCAQEPIRTPGSIQPHGILFVLSGPSLLITGVSANVAEHLGNEPTDLLGCSVSEVMDDVSFAAVQEASKRPEADGPGLVCLYLKVTSETKWRGVVHPTRNGALLEAVLPQFFPLIESADLFSRYDRSTRRLRGAKDIASVCQRLAEEVRELTGFDRVKIYRFARDWSGEVIAESMNDRLPSLSGPELSGE
jgi:light-regulated signal transduction histidine kinase (bacteriophytochrome)